MKNTFGFIFQMLVTFCSAQDVAVNPNGAGNLSPYIIAQMGFDHRYQGVKGSPLLFEDWQEGSILLVKQDTFSVPVKLNIDLVESAISVLLQNGTTGQIASYNVTRVRIVDGEGHARIWWVDSRKSIEGAKESRSHFYEVLHEGGFTLLKSIEKALKKADFEGAYNIGNRYDEFTTETSYWLRKKDQPFQKIRLKRKDMEKALSEYVDQVEEIVKKQKLNLEKEEDLIILIKILGRAKRCMTILKKDNEDEL